jgi:Domain of unknown function (DUF1833)
MALSEATREAYARAHSSTVHLYALELRHSVFPSPIRLLDYEKDVLLTLEVNAPVNAGEQVHFTGLKMKVAEPEAGTEADGIVEYQLDGVSSSVHEPLAAANQTEEAIEATVRGLAFNTSNDSVVEIAAIYQLQVRHISITNTTVGVALGYRNAANQAFPNVYYTAESNPGLV